MEREGTKDDLSPKAMIEEYSEEESVESYEENTMSLLELKQQAKELFQNKEYDNAIEFASMALSKGIEELEDEVHPDLADLYLDYGNYLLVNHEQTSEVFGAATNEADAKASVQKLLAQQVAGDAEPDDVIAFQMLDIARIILTTELDTHYPPTSNQCHLTALNMPEGQDKIAVPSMKFLATLSFDHSCYSSDHEAPSRNKLMKLVKDLCFVHRRLGDLYLAQDHHMEALLEFYNGMRIVENRLPYEDLTGGPCTHVAMMRQVSVSLAQSLQWTGDVENAYIVYQFALKLYRMLLKLPKDSNLLSLFDLTLDNSSVLECIDDLQVIIKDLDVIRETKTVTQSPSKIGRENALINSLPEGTLDGYEGTKMRFDSSAFGSENTVVDIAPTRKPKRLREAEEQGDAVLDEGVKRLKEGT